MNTADAILKILKLCGELTIYDDAAIIRIETPTVKLYLPKEAELHDIYETLKPHANVIIYDEAKKMITAKIWK